MRNFTKKRLARIILAMPIVGLMYIVQILVDRGLIDWIKILLRGS